MGAEFEDGININKKEALLVKQFLNDEEEKLKKTISERVIKNVNYERRRQKINISNLEKRLGVKSGYIRDIENNNYSKVPSLMFLYHASEELNVGMDELVKINMRSESKDDVLTRKFIKKIILLTNSDDLHWNIQTESQRIERIKNTELPNPLFVLEENADTARGKFSCSYYSHFTEENNMEIDGDMYYAKLDTNSMLCFVPVKYISEPDEDTEDFDIYILSGIKRGFNPFEDVSRSNLGKEIEVEPIICTGESETFDNMIYRLYSVINDSLSRSFLSDTSRDIMKRFID